jgi:hypothetical protein
LVALTLGCELQAARTIAGASAKSGVKRCMMGLPVKPSMGCDCVWARE